MQTSSFYVTYHQRYDNLKKCEKYGDLGVGVTLAYIKLQQQHTINPGINMKTDLFEEPSRAVFGQIWLL